MIIWLVTGKVLQSKSLRNIALKSHKLNELYFKVHLQAF